MRVNSLCLVKASGAFKNVPIAVVGVVSDNIDSKASSYKLEKAPKESFADVGGLEQQILELRETVELPITHPEYFEEMGISPPKGEPTNRIINALCSMFRCNLVRPTRNRKDSIGEGRVRLVLGII